MNITCKKCSMLLLILFFCAGVGFAQYTVKFHLSNVPLTHKSDSIFIAGSFTNWNPQSLKYTFSQTGDTAILIVPNFPAGNYSYKITRGNWQKVECAAEGKPIENRQLMLTSDTTIDVIVAAWQDDFPVNLKEHTASKNVHLLDPAFKIPQLGTTRAIWIYLPQGYDSISKKRYPVLYMNDGQNIFDEHTAAYGEWGVDECLDSLIKKGMPACIVVGIANGPNRMNEYNPYFFKDYGKGTGDAYVDFLAKTLKPFIDSHYKTLTTKEHTVIAGSSMGGLISYYALLKYPEIFGKAGVFSPAFWTADGIEKLTDSLERKINSKLFFYIGKLEGEKYVHDMNEIVQKLGKHSDAIIYSVIDPTGKHNEQAWRKWFPAFYTWIMADGFNYVINLEK